MVSVVSLAWSSVGKKFLMASTGLGLVGFTIMHLIGNLMLCNPNPDPFNKYAHFLAGLGVLVYVTEIGLFAFFMVHSVSGLFVYLEKLQARPEPYILSKNAGHSSRKNIASITMIYTGAILFIFIVLHLWQFKYGPYYPVTIDGIEMRDLYRVVIEIFSNPWWVLWYVAATGLIGFHLWHGFWSAFQSLGIYHPRLSMLINATGYCIALCLAFGYVMLPIWIYFTRGIQ